ncbi:gelsolin [Aethina tumida]|uniref:gelsolin n=1 Tax=Aethina tumida TaxID=116153 RepID=UPI00096B4103|nr:gelsolin [Aethina tumida]
MLLPAFKNMEPAFENAGKKEGIEIWRIENFKPVPYPTNDYGKFYTGDSYIILKTSKSLRDWDLFFWLGKETTQDESGSAAILTVALDDQLGGGPIEYREIQEHESQKFLSLFPRGIRYLPGGVTSGFNTYVETKETRLFHVKGKRNVRVKQVTPNISSMNQGDCFILDTGDLIYVYIGEKSRNIEKIKAIEAAQAVRDQDHAGKLKIEIVDQYSPEEDYSNFFNALGGGSRSAVPDATDDDDQLFELEEENVISLYQVSDASGNLDVKKVGEKPLEQSMLDSDDCFILDTGAIVFVWIGKGCTPQERRESMNIADKFLKSKNRPQWTKIQRIIQGTEPGAFTQYFVKWRATTDRKKTLVRADSTLSDADWEPRLIHAMIPTKGGKFKIEELFDFTQSDLNEDDIMLLDHGPKLFVWIGKGADEEERAQCDKLAQNYVKSLARSGVVIKTVHQGQEPADFKKGFPSWDPTLWDNQVSYRDIVKN